MKKNRIYRYFALIAAFLIGNYNGYIALWTDASDQPQKVFPYTVSSLPQADQALVNEGIRIESADELRRLLEDYLS